MKILYLCKRYYVNKDLIRDKFQRLYEIPMELSKHGCEVRVLALDYRTRERAGFQEEDCQFESLPVFSFVGVRMLLQLKKGVQEFGPDLVVASGNSNVGYLGRRLAKRFQVPFVFDLLDYYPGFASAKIPGMKYMFDVSMRDAHLVTCISEPLRQKSLEWNENALTIPSGVDVELFKPMEKQKARTQVGLNAGEKVVVYIGSLSERSGIPDLLKAMELLNEASGETVKLLIAGKNQDGFDLDKPFVDYRGLLPMTDLPAYINAGDVAVVPYYPTLQNEYAGPSKISEYLACRVPVVTTDIGNYADFFQDAPQSVCRPHDAADLAEKLRAQITAPQVASFPALLSWDEIGVRLMEAFTELV